MGAMNLLKGDYESLIDDIPAYGLGVRHVQVVLVCFFNFFGYAMASILPTCIVAMTDPTASPNPNIPTFPQWTNPTVIVVSFSWGLAVGQPVGGYFANKCNVKWTMVITMLIQVLSILSVPWVTVQFGSEGLIISSVIQGLFRGFGICMMPQFISHWVPLAEKSSLGNVVFAAFGPGSIFATNIAGTLSASMWGWPSVYYLNGALGSIWIILMMIYGDNMPEDNEMISKRELLYIKYKQHLNDKVVIPWKEVFRSKAVWAIFIAQCGGGVVYWICYIEFPMYMSGVYGLSVEVDSQILTIAFSISWILSMIAGKTLDFFGNNRGVKTEILRKVANSIASFGPAIFLTWMSFLNYNDIYLFLLLVIGLFATFSTFSCGFMINYNDISPNFCGFLFGIGNSISALAIQLAVILAQNVVVDQKDPAQWTTVLWFCSIVAVGTNIFYAIYGSGEIQTWNCKAHNGENEESVLESRPLK